jgi:ADP-ribosylglycohydrolase
MPKPCTLQPFLFIRKGDLEVERRQADDEGRDLASVRAEFDRLLRLDVDNDPSLRPAATALMEKVQSLPTRKGYKFKEPSDLAGIRKARPKDRPSIRPPRLTDARFHDKMYGAWLGRCCGCMAGKPVEGRRRRSMEKILKAQGRWPLSHYWSMKVDPKVAKDEGWFADYKGSPPGAVIEGITCMVEDDDTNYTATGFEILRRHGANFAPKDVADFWLGNIPFHHVYTAERVAYRSLTLTIPAPAPDGSVGGLFSSATWLNAYREWIGAQIRADFFGWASPGRPEQAAEWAWRDACISHVKNGIYGEMWVAAMLAAAWTTDDVEKIIRAGLGEVPARSRLAAEIHKVLGWKRDGWTFGQAIDQIHKDWDEAVSHHWCHTISNAAIVATGLLWGDLDFEKSVCRAVTCAFDTDCNGATVGSIVGLILGAKRMPKKWTAPIRDTLKTGIAGMNEVRLAAVAKESCDLVAKLNG